MSLYLNIHTHHVSQDAGVFVFNNRIGAEDACYTAGSFSAGIHPWDAASAGPEWYRKLEGLLTHPHCMAVGECGLDKLKGPAPEVQGRVFEAQLQLALRYRKPVIVHCVKAFDALVEMARSYAASIPLIVHGFHKSDRLAAQLIRQGFYLSLNPALFKRSDFDFAGIPLERLFLETDMLPNSEIDGIYQQASEKLGLSVDALQAQINRNFGSLTRSIK